MKLDFTTAGPTTTNLGDDSVKYTIELEQFGLEAIVQIEPLYNSETPFMAARGNKHRPFSFTSAKSFASMEAGASDAVGKAALVGLSGSLVWTINTHTVTMANAILRNIERVESDDAKGVRWKLRYAFEITTMVYA